MKNLLLTAAAIILFATAAHAQNVAQELDARIADAKRAEAAANKSAEVICGNAGYAMGQRELGLPSQAHEQLHQCAEATQAYMDASGFVGDLYEQRSHLTGQPIPNKYACFGKSSLGVPHQDAKGHYTVCPKAF